MCGRAAVDVEAPVLIQYAQRVTARRRRREAVRLQSNRATSQEQSTHTVDFALNHSFAKCNETGTVRPTKNSDSAASEISWINSEAFRPHSCNISPGGYLTILVSPNTCKKAFVLQTLPWGFRVPQMSSLLFNARSDSVSERASFRHHLQNRCIVLVTGFIEWKHFPNSPKTHPQPYYIYPKRELELSQDDVLRSANVLNDNPIQSRLMPLAGLYDSERCTILTVDASDSLKWCHNRMPAILDTPETVDLWLDNTLPFHEVKHVLTPSDEVQWHPINPNFSKRVESNTRDPARKSALDEYRPKDLMSFFSKSTKTEKLSHNNSITPQKPRKKNTPDETISL